MDFPYEVNPDERRYYWGTRFSDERKMFSFAPDNLPQNAETSADRDGYRFSTESGKPWPGAYGISAQIWSEIWGGNHFLTITGQGDLAAKPSLARHQTGWRFWDYLRLY